MWCVEFFVAFDVVGLSGAATDESAFPPEGVKEIAQGAFDSLPQVFIVGFKDDPLGAEFNGFFDVAHQASDVDVTPFDVVGFDEGACAPNADASVREAADAVNAEGV